MAPTKNTKKKLKNGKKAASASSGLNLDLNSAVQSLVNDKLKDILGECSTDARRMKRLSSERDEDSESDMDDTPAPKQQKQSKPAATTTAAATEYATQVVILEGVDAEIKNHPTRLSKALAEVKPNLSLRPDGLRITASGDVLVKPKNPKDCNSLLKKDAFPSPCALGQNVVARVPKEQQIIHQVIIKNVDESVTQEEMDEILVRQELPYKKVKRIISRERGTPTKLFRLILKDEDTKKRLLRQGINLDQMHYKCEAAKEDLKTFPKLKQCFKCQQIGDHFVAECTKEQKCVLCAGPHRKSECTVGKDNYKCANCEGKHAAWSLECPQLRQAADAKKTPTFAQMASAAVTPQLLQQVIQEVKESVVMLVTEVVARSICELVYEIQDRNVSKLALPMKVGTISTNATNAANKLKFGPATTPVDKNEVKERVMAKCFPKPTSAEQASCTQSGGSNPART